MPEPWTVGAPGPEAYAVGYPRAHYVRQSGDHETSSPHFRAGTFMITGRVWAGQSMSRNGELYAGSAPSAAAASSGVDPRPLGLDDHAEQADVARRREAGHPGQRQRPGHRSRDAGLVVERLVPGGVAVLLAARPVLPGDGLDEHQPGVLPSDLVGELLVSRAERRVAVQHDVHRREHGGERVPAQRLEVGRRGAVAVPGDADRADQALVLRAQRSLERAALAGHLVELVEVADRVQLQQVDAVGLQPLERAVDRRARRLPRRGRRSWWRGTGRGSWP